MILAPKHRNLTEIMADLNLKEQIAALTKAVQDQTAKIDRIGADVAAVDAKVGALDDLRPALADLALWRPRAE